MPKATANKSNNKWAKITEDGPLYTFFFLSFFFLLQIVYLMLFELKMDVLFSLVRVRHAALQPPPPPSSPFIFQLFFSRVVGLWRRVFMPPCWWHCLFLSCCVETRTTSRWTAGTIRRVLRRCSEDAARYRSTQWWRLGDSRPNVKILILYLKTNLTTGFDCIDSI